MTDIGGTAATISMFRGNCFNCGKPGHMAKDCWVRKNNNFPMRTSYMNSPNVLMDEEEDMSNVQPPLQGNRVHQMAQMLVSLSNEELNQAMNQVPAGENQDFVGA